MLMTCYNLLSDDDGFKEKFLKMKQQSAIFFPKKTLYMSQGFCFWLPRCKISLKTKKLLKNKKNYTKHVSRILSQISKSKQKDLYMMFVN
jgi:hypothetical protein